MTYHELHKTKGYIHLFIESKYIFIVIFISQKTELIHNPYEFPLHKTYAYYSLHVETHYLFKLYKKI